MKKKKTCGRKRILNKDGSINKANVEHNKKCEKDMVKDNPWLNEPGGKEYAEEVLGKDNELMKEIKKEIKKTNARRKRIRRNKKKKESKKPTKAKKKPKKQKGGALCVPCISPVLTGLGLFGAGAAAAKAGSSVIQKHSSISSSSSDGKNISRKENFQLFEKAKQGKKIHDHKRKFTISQQNKKVVIQDGKKKTKDKFKTIQKASDFYNKKVVECKKKGFKKCTKRTKKFPKKKKSK